MQRLQRRQQQEAVEAYDRAAILKRAKAARRAERLAHVVIRRPARQRSIDVVADDTAGKRWWCNRRAAIRRCQC